MTARFSCACDEKRAVTARAYSLVATHFLGFLTSPISRYRFLRKLAKLREDFRRSQTVVRLEKELDEAHFDRVIHGMVGIGDHKRQRLSASNSADQWYGPRSEWGRVAGRGSHGNSNGDRDQTNDGHD